MPEGNVTYHGSAFGDIAEEWHKLPTWGKFAVGGLFVAVAGIGLYEYNKNKSSGVTPSGSSAGSPADLSGAGANQFPTVPGGNTGTVPVLPGGVCPVFDSSGNLVAFGPCTGATGGTNNPPGGTMPPQPVGKPFQFQRYSTDENGHMQTVRHGVEVSAQARSLERMPPQPIGIYPIRPIIHNNPLIKGPPIKR